MASSSAIRCSSAASDEPAVPGTEAPAEPVSEPRDADGSDWNGEESGDQPQRASSRGSGPSSRTSFPTMAGATVTAERESALPSYSEWSGAGSGGREDGDYNLEAFVSAETTLADHLAEQMALAISDPARPHDRPVSDRYGRRGRLSHRRSRLPSPRSSARRWRDVEARAGDPADASIRPASARAISPNASRCS